MTGSRALVLAGALALTAVGVRAQEPQRQGLWGLLGLGYGSAGIDCTGCSPGRAGGLALSGYLGGTPTPHVRIGFGGYFWFHSLASDTLEQINTLGAAIWIYPWLHHGPFAEAGLGFSQYEATKGSNFFSTGAGYSPDTTYASGSGWAGRIGAGWEGPVTLRLVYTFTGIGRSTQAPGATSRMGHDVLAFEIAIAGHL